MYPAKTQDEEYELVAAERVVTDPKILAWRRQCLELLGFEGDECDRLAARAEVNVRAVETWLAAGATHLQVLAIVAPC